jgi:4a-hydroxytetrahydrobiopterin dehydratase
MTATMASELAKKDCTPCKGGTPPLKGDALKQMQSQLGDGWQVLNEQKLEKQFKFPDFKQALAFVNRVGDVAEQQNHHPDIYFTWGLARIQISTHSIGGLSESDFILAAKISELK